MRITMSAINGIGNNSPIQNITSTPAARPAVKSPTSTRATDRLELSGVSYLLASLKNNDVRVDKVASVKAQLETDNYENNHKLDVAVDRLLDDLIK
jgi:hypothetical protein